MGNVKKKKNLTFKQRENDKVRNLYLHETKVPNQIVNFRPNAGKIQINLDHLAVPGNNEVLKKQKMVSVRGTQEST